MPGITYPFIVVPDDDSYWIAFPDCEGCMTQVSRSEDIADMAADVLALWLATRAELGIPEPKHEYDGEQVIGETWWQEVCK